MSKFFTLFLKRLVPLGLAASAAAMLLAPGAAQATPYVLKLVQRGNHVVATGSGAFDLTGLTFSQSGTSGTGLEPDVGYISSGPFFVRVDFYTGYTGPTNFGSGSGATATSGSGDYVGIDPVYFGVPYLYTPSGYVSNMGLSNSATYDNASFASLGVTPGTYVWTWGAGADQSFTLDIVEAPEPAALGMFGLGVLLIGAFVGRRRRASQEFVEL